MLSVIAPLHPAWWSRGHEYAWAQRLVSSEHVVLAAARHLKETAMDPTVTLAIIARNKAHCLPEYLACIEALDYPKDRIAIEIRTDGNTDDTASILAAWAGAVGGLYRQVKILTDIPDAPEHTTAPHDWPWERLERIGRIRQASLDAFRAGDSDYYFVVDCDNFISPSTLRDLIDSGKGFIAPMLMPMPNSGDFYSNFFMACSDNGYWAESDRYMPIRFRQALGIFEAPVVHCTYLISRKASVHLSYADGTRRMEFVIFSESARRSGVTQWITNLKHYGFLMHPPESVTLEEESSIYSTLCKPQVRTMIVSPESLDALRPGEETFHGWYRPGGEG